jgi:hypothetical protein
MEINPPLWGGKPKKNTHTAFKFSSEFAVTFQTVFYISIFAAVLDRFYWLSRSSPCQHESFCVFQVFRMRGLKTLTAEEGGKDSQLDSMKFFF